MAKRLPGLFGSTDVLDLDSQLWVELELYAAEESRVQREQAARDRPRGRRGMRAGKGPGR